MFLKVSNLSKQYADQWALNEINFSIDNKGIVGVLGPNGAGKSTLMKIIVGAIKPEKGELFILDEKIDFNKSTYPQKGKIGYLPEDNPLYGEMYVVEYLEFCARIHQVQNPKSRIQKVILETGLQSEQHKKIQELSKGYKQRVGLAQAILHDPDILILDEPTSGLDPLQLIEIRSLIKKLGEEKIVILSSHIMQEIEALCDEIIILKKGELITRFEKNSWRSLYGDVQNLEELFIRLTEK